MSLNGIWLGIFAHAVNLKGSGHKRVLNVWNSREPYSVNMNRNTKTDQTYFMYITDFDIMHKHLPAYCKETALQLCDLA